MSSNHIETRGADPRSRQYSLGLYRILKFNGEDLRFRRRYGLCAVKIFPAKEYSLISRMLGRSCLIEHSVVPCSRVLSNPNGERGSFVLYLPFGRGLEDSLR